MLPAEAAVREKCDELGVQVEVWEAPGRDGYRHRKCPGREWHIIRFGVFGSCGSTVRVVAWEIADNASGRKCSVSP